MHRVGGFRSIRDLEAFGRGLEEKGFYVDIKPHGKFKYLEVKSDNLQMELYLREVSTPDKYGELTQRDETLVEIVKAKYPYERQAKLQLSC